MILYREAVGIISNAPLRDANDLIKQNYPVWCNGFTPVGCFNKKIEEPLDEEICVSIEKNMMAALLYVMILV